MTQTEMDSDIYAKPLPSMQELLARAEQKGRADVIREIEEIECEGLQREDGKYIKLSSFQQKLEQIKEQKNE